MTGKLLITVTTAIVGGLLAYGGTAVEMSAEAEGTSAIITAPRTIDPYVITDLIYNGRADSALIVLDSPEFASTTDPMVYMLRARSIRDQLDDEDDNKDLIKIGTEPIHAQLDTAISLCDQALDHKASDPIYHYYRGRAWLGKAQAWTLTRSYWSAGRAAGRAKSDLEAFLKVRPDHADAQGDLGAFLYFADTLPGVIKFVSKLLRFPGGDRERGLEMLDYASSNRCVFQVDYQIAVAAIDLLFEGRLHRGVAGMSRLIDENPRYTRLVEPFGVLAPLDPLRIREYQAIEDRVIATRLGMVDARTDWSLIKRIGVHRAYADMYFRSPKEALRQFTAFIEDPIDRPDWLMPLALINRGQLYAKSGRTEEARRDFDVVRSDDSMEHFHDLAGKMTDALDKPSKTVDLADLDFIGMIYDNDLAAAGAGLKEYGRIYGRDVIYYFYLGELEVFAQDFNAAQRAYETCVMIEVQGGDQSYQMLSALRLAEIEGMKKRYSEGKNYVEKATKYVHVGYLLDFMIHSRARYFELMEKGVIDIPSPLLVREPASGFSTHAAPQPVHE